MMAKFCQKCGNLVDDNVTVCNRCGSQVMGGYVDDQRTVSAENNPYTYNPSGQPAVPQPQAPNPYDYTPAPVGGGYNQPLPLQPPKKKKTGLIITICVVAVLIVAALVLLVILPLTGTDVFGLKWFSGAKNSTPQACLQTFVEEMADDHIDEALDCIYETKYSEMMRSVMKLQFTSSSNSDTSSMMTAFRSLGKENVKKLLTLTVTDEQDVSASELESYKKTLSEATIPVDKIQRIEKAKIHMKNNENGQTQDRDFYFVQAEGKWYILAIAMADM